jgi:putative peptidoglycan lipid II flippase
MHIIALITIPITFFSLAQGSALIRLLFQSNSFGEDSVRLTLAAFRFHIPGLFFIALNRILAPAFYAQSDSKSPSLAGIICFGVNIGLAVLLAGPMQGAGIALALSLASAVNTALLLFFLRKNPHIAVGKALKAAVLYALKLAVFSSLALLPVLWLSPSLTALCAGSNRFILHGVPLILTALVYAALGLVLLIISRDRQVWALLRMLKKKTAK